MPAVLEICNLTTTFITSSGVIPVLRNVTLELESGSTLALVGESGSGKSVTALSVMRLLPEQTARIAEGRILLEKRDLLSLSEADMRQIRGNEISMIFQEPMTSLNPVVAVGGQIMEALRAHRSISRGEARARAIELLRRVRMPDPEIRFNEYPHRLSGGMRQRVMIAMALAGAPKVIIADEPTTALDVTIQAQILELLAELQKSAGMSIILITHDLGVVAQMADRVAVMYAGAIVEQADVAALFVDPLHPYTAGLLGATPDLDAPTSTGERRLVEISGSAPSFDDLPFGCSFAPRCARAVDRCRSERPELRPLPDGRKTACLVEQEARGL